ncbi:MAG: DUF1772 domain-containing protein [Acidobacteria bacterium]|nr:DUF1772 domain-containing protein [Acidobacteriota bacterium]
MRNIAFWACALPPFRTDPNLHPGSVIGGQVKVMDRVIQNNQPIFMLVWVGSVVALGTAAVLGIVQLDGAERLLIIFAALAYFLGVQLPTIRINIPLNNQLQTLDVDAMNESTQKAARQDFEPRWNLWNSIRTAFASLASALLIILLFRL